MSRARGNLANCLKNNATIFLMDSLPLKRIYFDTNILYRWPHPPNDIVSVFGSAKWLGTELYVPEVVEGELEAQFVRSVRAAYGTLEQNVKELDKLCRDVIAVDVKGTRPDEDQLRQAYRARSGHLKTHFGISSIPLPSLDLRVFVDMAISRTAPFEECESGKQKVVVGLQDAAILFSILDHMRTAAEGDRCALISSDHIFHAAETRKIVELTGIKLQTFKKVSDLFEDLFNHVWDATRTAWQAEMKEIETSLNDEKVELAKQIFPFLTTSEVGQSIWKRAKQITGFSVTEFRYVLTELPESEHRPPHAGTYKRLDGSDVKISAKASTEIEAIVETTSWLGLFSFPGAPTRPDPAPKTENNTFHETLNVSLTGTARNGVIGEFRVTGVDASRP